MDNQRFGIFLNKYWLLVFSLGYGLFVGLPFLAPVLMELGLTKAANVIYTIYSFLCHQFPQRSYFLFGEKLMYSLAEVQDAWQVTNNPLILRKFIGIPQMGWKVAWSDRMVSLYTGILIVSWIWYPLRKKIKELPVWGFMLFLLPIAIDGTTHMFSDLSGIGQGFRDSNLWLAQFTNFQLPAGFYVGDTLGSFNSWMRILSGISFAVGVVWYGFPYINDIIVTNIESHESKRRALEDLKHQALKDLSAFKAGRSFDDHS